MILALDSSTSILSVALVQDGKVLAEATHPSKAGDALPGALLALGPIDQVKGICVGLGPGSFTGLRVGLASAKALAYARRWPIAGASSLAALAHGVPGLVCATIEGRRGELFIALYQDGIPTSPERIVKAAELSSASGGARVLAGTPPASAIARLARLPPAFDAEACFALAPNYLQAPTAEVALAEGRVGGLPKRSA